MKLFTIKNLYNILKTSDDMSLIRHELHSTCDKIDFSVVEEKYIASKDILLMINFIKNEYEKMIAAEKTVYKISDEELNIRIEKLKKVAMIYNTYKNPYIRFDKMSKLFKNPSVMHKSYILLIRYGKEDHKLDEIRSLLNNFDTYYRDFRDSYKNDIHNTVYNAYYDDDMAQKLKYSTYIIDKYINDENSYLLDEFLAKYGINKEILKEIKQIVKNNNKSLYYEFVIKENNNEKLLNSIYAYTIDDLNYAIKNGEFIYGNHFNEIEFIKLIPFKDSDNFYSKIDDFMAIHNLYARNNILKYLKDHHLDKKDAFKLIDPGEVKNKKAIINNNTFSEDQMNIVIDYLLSKEIPICRASIVACGKEFLENGLSIKPNTLTLSKKENKPILIPTINS